MTYLGNPSLPSDVQQRIRSTFEHTLALAEKGSRQESLLGCDFVLRMDPLFEPARRLQERLESSDGPLAVDDLRRLEGALRSPTASNPTGQQPAESLWVDLDGLATELPELPEGHPGAFQTGAAPPDLRGELESLLAERRFQELQMRAAQAPAAVTADPAVQHIVALAQQRLEAGPYVSKFLQSAREASRTGNAVEANRLLQKARALDPTHPGIAELAVPPGGPPPLARPPAGGAGGTLLREPELQTQPVAGLPRAAAPLPPPPPPLLAPQPEAPPLPPGAPAGQQAQAAQAPQPAQSPQPLDMGDSESERRIGQLLGEGQAALDGGDPQAAIDVWSRIFLIDIDHQEAARRIENARRMKAERDRQVEETFHDGLGRVEARDLEGARQAFQQVLELQPGHLQAREYLQQLDEGNFPATLAAGGRRPLAASSPLGTTSQQSPPLAPLDSMAAKAPLASPGPVVSLPAELVRAAGLSTRPPDADLQEEILVPPDVDNAAAHPPEQRREARSASAGRGRARRLFLVVGSAVLLLALAVGWFLYQRWEQWFPNSRTEEPAQPPAPNPIPRATKLHDSGRGAIALTQLRRVPPGDPHYKEAQALIAKWQDEQPPSPAAAPATAAGGAAGAPSAAGAGVAGAMGPDQHRRLALLEDAKGAYQDGTYLLAAERYEAADRLAKLDPGDAAQLSQAKQQLVPIQRQIAMFRGHDWEYALPELWRLHESDPANKDVTRMIVDCYYNLGVRDLQHNDSVKAAQKFTEAKSLAPGDAEIKRQLLFAQTYQEHNADLLYRIYVKYLQIR